ncbi:hypothetical protein ACN47E_006422 [Coniothyrium glycines]
MEPATAGVLYAAENLLQGAAALVKGVTHPTLPIKANLTHLSSVPFPRSHHTVTVVKGRAYIFGGEVAPGKLADNDMHVVILPSSGVLEADYTSYPARSTNGLDDVPVPRRKHTAVAIGNNIYLFGGQGDGVTHEKARVWVYSTVSNSWSFLDPAPESLKPSPRYSHAAASSDLPGPRATTYQEKAPQAPADPAKVVPEPAEPDSWGTIFVVGGRAVLGDELSVEALAFDVRTRTWSNIPAPTGEPRDGASIALVGDQLYRFGGKGEAPAATATEFLDVSHVWKHAESGTTPLSTGWTWQELPRVKHDGSAIPAPAGRYNAGLVGVTTGQGRQYLLAVGGADDNQTLLEDIWALQLAPEASTAAAAKDSIRHSIKRDTHESEWAEVQYSYVDTKGEEEINTSKKPSHGIGARAYFGISKGTEIDGATCILWGGLDAEGNVLSDGWMITVDR